MRAGTARALVPEEFLAPLRPRAFGREDAGAAGVGDRPVFTRPLF
ncbi:hypothetical protein ACF082_26500 [Streptomyces lydicus]